MTKQIYQNTFYILPRQKLMEQKQQYPTINCKKVSKAKTTSLKLYDQDESSQDSVEKNQKFNHNTTIKQQGVKNMPKSQNFSYLEQSRNGLGKGKSFQDIMEESRKILQMRKQFEDEQKKKEESKKSKKAKKTQRKKNQVNFQKKKPMNDKQKEEEKEIYVSEIDIQKFSTQSVSIKKLVEKIDWLRNLGQRCNIISPFLQQIQKASQQSQEEKNPGKMSSKKQLFINQNDDMLIKVSQLELEIELMKRNLDQNLEAKDFLNPFEISQLAKLQIKQKSTQGAQKLKDSYMFLDKYLDRENLQIYAEDLQNQLEHMEKVEFRNFNDQEDD